MEHPNTLPFAELHKMAEEKLSSLGSQPQELNQILSLQLSRNSIYSTYLSDLRALEHKYNQLYTSIYSKRCELLKPLGGFWLKSMKNNPLIASTIQKQDKSLLKKLYDIKLNTEEKSKSFSVDFYFAENPFIQNTVLRKKFTVNDNDNLESCESTVIEWKDRNLTESQTGEKISSFFWFFSDEESDAEQDLEEQFEIGKELRDEVIPNVLLYYLIVKRKESRKESE